MYRLWLERPLPPQCAALLDGVATVVGVASETPAEPLRALVDAEGIIAGSRVQYDAALLEQAPALRVISRTGIGLDNIAIAAATARGVAVCNAPDAPTISTAEHTITLLLAVARDLKRLDRLVREGATTDYFGAYNGLELDGLQLGVVGLGRIGGRVATLARGLGMAVVAFDPIVAPQRAAELGVTLAPDLETLLRGADAVTLHVPLGDATRHLIDARRLALMKPGAILINAARGGLVDEAALLAALEQGRLRGAGLDVFEQEPPQPGHPLLGRDDVVATPHIASATSTGKIRLWQEALTQALQVLRGERPPHLVNPEIWPAPRR